MAGLGLALMNAASGYMRGREQRRQSEVEDQRYADQRARQAEQDARAREMMAVQVEQMRAAQQERAAASARQAEMDQRNAYEGGYRPQADVGRMGEAFNVGPSPTVGAVGDAMQSVGALGGAMRSAAKAPSAFTLRGAPMVKSAESTTETRDNRAMAMQDARAREHRAQELADAEAARNFQRSQQDRSFAQQRSLLETRTENAQQPKVPQTDGTRKAAGFLERVVSALPRMEEFEPKGDVAALHTPARKAQQDSINAIVQTKSQKAASALPFYGDRFERGMMSTTQQEYDAAKRDFLSAILRKESGAVITPSEWEEGTARYFPVAGDSPEGLAAKRKNRAAQIRALQIEAGYDAPGSTPQQRPQGQRPPLAGGWVQR